MIDFGGRVAIPGINDTHSHMGYFAPIGAVVQVQADDWVQGPDPHVVLASATERFFPAADLPIRIRLIQWPFPGRASEWTQIKDHRPFPLTYISGVKYVIDGTPIDQWALMHQPYEGRPGWHGHLYDTEDVIRGFLQEALKQEDQLMLHVVGDSTVTLVIDLMHELAPDSTWQSLRVRFEHANGIVGSNVEAARSFGIVVSQARADAAQMRMWHDAGIPMAHGADGPINPWHDFMWQMEEKDSSEVLAREVAMRMFTVGSAYAEVAECEKGTLAPGMLADLAVLSQNVFAVPSEALSETGSLFTMVGGVVVHDAGVLRATVSR